MTTDTYPCQPVPEAEFRQPPPDLQWICRVLYDTYHLTNREDIRYNMRVAMGMAQAMTKRLKDYRRETGHS